VFKVITLSAALETTSGTREPHQLPRRRAHPARRPRHPRFARRHGHRSHARWCWRIRATSAPSRSACRWAASTCTTTCAASASARRPASRCPVNRAVCGRLTLWGSTSLESDFHGAGSQRHHPATGAGRVGGGQRRAAGEAAPGAENGAAPPIEPPVRAIKPETAITMRQMMEGVVLVRHRKEPRLDGYTSGGKTGSAQIFDFATGVITPTLQRIVHGLCAADQSRGGGGSDVNGTHGQEGFGGAAAGSGVPRRDRKRCASWMFPRICREPALPQP
jgi:hypothetical protein